VADARGGEYLDAPRLLPFWEAVAHLDVPIYRTPRRRWTSGCTRATRS
jgi:predicted TIM-barrel fold metal-dependent hydrolase